MNDPNKGQGNKLPDEEYINGAWIDVKLCTVRSVKRQQKLADIINKKSNLKDSSSSSFYYNELHYGNYE